MALTELLQKEHVVLDIEVNTREACIDKLTEIFAKTGVVKDEKVYKQAVYHREEEGTTGIGFGVAIPHGKSNGVSKPGLVFARVANGLDWDSLDGTPVRLVFLIAVPDEKAGNEHLQILSQLSRKLVHEEFREQLMNANSIEEVIGALE